MAANPPPDKPAAKTEPPGESNRPRSLETLKEFKDFRLVWIGNFFATGAQWLQVFTIGWLVLQLTDGNAFLTGTSIGIRFFAVLLIGPWAGVLADRLDRRMLVMTTQIGMAVAAGLFAALVIASDVDSDEVSGPIRVWHPFVYMFIAGVAHAIIQPVRGAMVANTVPKERLTTALALNAMSFPLSRMTGPALGGLLIATLGFKWNFGIEAGLYVVMVMLLLPVKLRYQEERSSRSSSMFANLKEGLIYVRRDRTMLQIIVMSFIPNLIFQPLVFVLPVFTTEVLDKGSGTGGLLAASVGVGGFAAAMLVSALGYGVPKGTATSVGLIGGCAFIVAFTRSDWLAASIPLLIGLGFCQFVFRTANNTLLQIMVPDAYRGRVTAIYQLDNGFIPLSTMLISLFIHLWNPSDAFTVIAGVSLVLAVVQVVLFREARSLP